MRLVTAASADKTVQPSTKGSSGADVADLDQVVHHGEPDKARFSAHCAFAFTASIASAGSGPYTHNGLKSLLFFLTGSGLMPEIEGNADPAGAGPGSSGAPRAPVSHFDHPARGADPNKSAGADLKVTAP
jgi:hypothetical protein